MLIKIGFEKTVLKKQTKKNMDVALYDFCSFFSLWKFFLIFVFV